MDVRIRRFFCALLIGLLPLSGAAQAGETPPYVRLHVVANSDSAADQSLKLKVRDGVRILSAALLADAQSADEAWEILGENLSLLEGAALLCARLGGFWGEVRAEMGEFDFPERTYGQEVVPSGRYRALRVVLGEGEGRNWWCVLYPSLCAEGLETGSAPAFYSVIGQWLESLAREVGQWLRGD